MWVGIDRQRAAIDMDSWAAYKKVIPSKRHQVVAKRRERPAILSTSTVLETANIVAGEESFIFFQDAGKSHRRDLECCPSL